MASLFIDGYNLIGTQRGDLAAEREALIEALIDYRKAKHHNITLVFDGHIDGGHESIGMRGGLRVVYTGLGERADDAILRMLPRGAEAIVISSDRQVQAGAQRAGAVPVGSGDFMRKLDEALDGHGDKLGYGDPDEEYEDLYAPPQRKGNPQKDSKRDKALKRALSKL